MPMNVDQIFEAELKAQETDGAEVDFQLKNDIETIVMKWFWQINNVLKEESMDAFTSDMHPLPSAGIQAIRKGVFHDYRIREFSS